MIRPPGGLLVIACALASGACYGVDVVSPTQTIVIIRAEQEVKGRTDRLDIVVRSLDDDRTHEEESVERGNGLQWPYTVALAPRDGDASRRFELVATARDASGDFVASVRATSGYVAHRQLVLELTLEDRCIGRSCKDDETCRAGGCASASVEPKQLPRYTGAPAAVDAEPDAGAPDAGVVTIDAGFGPAPDDAGATGTAGTSAPPARPPRCGDGILGSGETCDIGIPPGAPGACPSECPVLAACLPQRLEGTACTARCVLDPPACIDGDACCPSECAADTDSDCSQGCGDGSVDPAQGETCEPDHATLPCPTDCDDGNVCTMDLIEGSADNCNALCTHVALGPASGDGCCPQGANANVDSDCIGDCGNGVREGDEECDGSPGCDNCKLTVTAEQQQCLDAIASGAVDPACQQCECVQCTQLALDCYLDQDATRSDACQAIADCAHQANCTGSACYCGPATTLCGGLFGPATGPCAAEIEAAAGTADPLVIESQQTDATTALGRANALGSCGATQCSDVCP